MSKPFSHLYSGGKVYGPDDTDLDAITLEDIAHGLATMCRFRGQLGCFYSVAEHSILCARQFLLDGDVYGARAALCHDFAEAIVSDIPSPHKPLIAGWNAYEDKWQDNLMRRFNLPPKDDAVWQRVHTVDKAIVHREARVLPRRPLSWYDSAKDALIHPSIIPVPLDPSASLAHFRAACSMLL